MSVIDKVISAVTPSRDKEEEQVDAIDLLKQDHDDVDALFKEYDMLADDGKRASNADRRDLSRQICGMLVIHTMVEEEIFYPAASRSGVDPQLMSEAKVEHASAKDLIAQIGAMDAGDVLYDAKVKVLAEYIRHHVKEEEHEMFPACRKTDMDLHALGKKIKSRKEALMKKMNGQS
jgi:hypothetical protein